MGVSIAMGCSRWCLYIILSHEVQFTFRYWCAEIFSAWFAEGFRTTRKLQSTRDVCCTPDGVCILTVLRWTWCVQDHGCAVACVCACAVAPSQALHPHIPSSALPPHSFVSCICCADGSRQYRTHDRSRFPSRTALCFILHPEC